MFWIGSEPNTIPNPLETPVCMAGKRKLDGVHTAFDIDGGNRYRVQKMDKEMKTLFRNLG